MLQKTIKTDYKLRASKDREIFKLRNLLNDAYKNKNDITAMLLAFI